MYTGQKVSEWSKSVRLANHNRCIICKRKATTAHHCVSRRLYPEYRFDWRCGVALCEPCHVFIHKDEGRELRERIARNFLATIGKYDGYQRYFKANDQRKVRTNEN